MAGEVEARCERRRVRSDWIAVERERGLSVSSTVMSFEREGLPPSTSSIRLGACLSNRVGERICY